MKKIYRNTIYFIFSFCIVCSCEFGDVNTDPANPISVTIATLLPTAEARLTYIFGGDFSRYNGVFTQHFAGGGRQHLLIGQNGFSESDVNTSWLQLYAGALQDLNQIIILSNDPERESPHYRGIAKILMANTLGLMSDQWNHIPYSEAFQGEEGNISPKYDSRDEIYQTIHTLLSEARSDLSEENSALSPGAEDLLYGGDRDKWKKISYLFDARYYINRGQWQDALNALAESKLKSNDEDLQFNFGSAATENNPWFQFEQQRGDVSMGEFFINTLNTWKDPRLPMFATKAPDGTYKGAPAGAPKGGESAIGSYYGGPTSPVVLGSYVEAKFIEAEANFRLTKAGDAATALKMAIEASVSKITGSSDAAFVATQTSGTVTLEKILLHKYVALFTQPITASDWRRTKMPALSPPENNKLKNKDDMILRWPYPQSERNFNFENFQGNSPSLNVNEVLVTPLKWF